MKALASRGQRLVDTRVGDPVEQILDPTDGRATDKGCECVGWQAHDPDGDEHADLALNNAVRRVRATGEIGVVGVSMPRDPKSADPLGRDGRIPFDLGLFFQRGLKMGSDQRNVKAHNRQVRDLIAAGKAEPSFVVTHSLSLEEAPQADRRFDQRDEGWTKVVLHP